MECNVRNVCNVGRVRKRLGVRPGRDPRSRVRPRCRLLRGFAKRGKQRDAGSEIRATSSRNAIMSWSALHTPLCEGVKRAEPFGGWCGGDRATKSQTQKLPTSLVISRGCPQHVLWAITGNYEGCGHFFQFSLHCNMPPGPRRKTIGDAGWARSPLSDAPQVPAPTRFCPQQKTEKHPVTHNTCCG